MDYSDRRRVLRVNLTEGTVRVEELSWRTMRATPGGRGVAAAGLLDELDPAADPLGPASVLAFAVGVGAHLRLPGFSRFTVAGKSPLTGAYGEAEAGGHWAAALKEAGFDLCLVSGRASAPLYLLIADGAAELRDAEGLWGLSTSETEAAVRADLGNPLVQVVSIGPGGENQVPCACIMHAGRAAGRGGFGAALGAKRLKAVAVRGTSTSYDQHGCGACPLQCKRSAGGRCRSALAGLGLRELESRDRAGWLCNEYGLDAHAAEAAVRGALQLGLGRGEPTDQVCRLITLLAQNQLPDVPPIQPTHACRPKAAPSLHRRAAEALGICQRLAAPGGPLPDLLAAARAMTGWSLALPDLLLAEAYTESLIEAFNLLVRGAPAAHRASGQTATLQKLHTMQDRTVKRVGVQHLHAVQHQPVRAAGV